MRSSMDYHLPPGQTCSIITTDVIDAHERRNVAVIDVENVFLQSENNLRSIMAICGT